MKYRAKNSIKCNSRKINLNRIWSRRQKYFFLVLIKEKCYQVNIHPLCQYFPFLNKH